MVHDVLGGLEKCVGARPVIGEWWIEDGWIASDFFQKNRIVFAN